jgi:hypothetical protein
MGIIVGVCSGLPWVCVQVRQSDHDLYLQYQPVWQVATVVEFQINLATTSTQTCLRLSAPQAAGVHNHIMENW